MQDGVLNLSRVKLRDQQRLAAGPLTEYSQYGEGTPFGDACFALGAAIACAGIHLLYVFTWAVFRRESRGALAVLFVAGVGLAVGSAAADATVLDEAGKSVALASLWAEKPTLLVFYRGGW